MTDPAAFEDLPARGRLLAEATHLLALEGAGAITARALAARTGLSLSATNYHFGGREGLLAACFAEACARARESRARWLDQLPAGPAPDACLGWLQSLALEPPHGGDHPLALLRELRLAARRDAGLRPLAAADLEDESRFWRAAVVRFGRDTAEAPLFAHFVAGLGGGHAGPRLELAERAWMFETCRRFLGRLDHDRARTSGWDGWRQARLAAASDSRPPEQMSEARLRLLEACVAVVGRGGLPGLTHRAVAAAAGVPLATVTRNFPTRSELVRGTFSHLHGRVQTRSRARQAPAGRLSPAALAEEIAGAVFDEAGAPAAEVIALEELIAYAQRVPELRRAADFLRASRGEGSASALGRLETVRPDLDTLDAYLLSTVLQGAIRASYARAPGARRAWLEQQAELALARLFA
ncbi:TetR family transcriptional regulator [Phenylobacterium sp.]|uniref:TetR family transcriptional regulator n=1 Tax=Phenylobacterium sp. TaxID=1871053 RepID=UPI0035B4F6CC